MGSGLSTRSTPDYVYVFLNVSATGHVRVNMVVFNTENRLKLRKYMRDRDDAWLLASGGTVAFGPNKF